MGHPLSWGLMLREKQILRPAYPMDDSRRPRGPRRAGSQDDNSPTWCACFPMSENPDMGHPWSWGLMLREKQAPGLKPLRTFDRVQRPEGLCSLRFALVGEDDNAYWLGFVLSHV